MRQECLRAPRSLRLFAEGDKPCSVTARYVIKLGALLYGLRSVLRDHWQIQGQGGGTP